MGCGGLLEIAASLGSGLRLLILRWCCGPLRASEGPPGRRHAASLRVSVHNLLDWVLVVCKAPFCAATISARGCPVGHAAVWVCSYILRLCNASGIDMPPAGVCSWQQGVASSYARACVAGPGCVCRGV